MKAHIYGVVLAAAVFFVATASAQSTQSSGQERQGARNQATVTVEGCVVREADVPGRDKDDDDFILTEVKMIKGSAPAGAKAQAGTTESVGTSGTLAAMFDIEGFDDARLSKLVGQRVQIDGRFDDIDDPDDKDDLMEIRGTTIRPVEGQCSVKR